MLHSRDGWDIPRRVPKWTRLLKHVSHVCTHVFFIPEQVDGELSGAGGWVQGRYLWGAGRGQRLLATRIAG